MSTKDWPRLMSVSPVAVVGGEDRTALRAGLPFYAMPAHVTDGDALGEDEVFLFAPAGHQPDDGRTVNVRVMSEDECKAEYRAWWIARYPDDPIVFDRGWLFHLDRARAMGAVR